MSDITWTNSTRKLNELIPWELNPKRLSEKQGAGLRVSIDKFGLAIPLLISPTNELYDGHQRQALLERMDDYGPDAVVDVRVSSRELTFDERRELVVRLRENQAGWDFDALGNIYEPEELEKWGFPEWKLADFVDDPVPSLDDLADQYGDIEDRDFWPYIQVQVSPETNELWLSFMRQLPGEDEAIKAQRILEAVDASILDSVIS